MSQMSTSQHAHPEKPLLSSLSKQNIENMGARSAISNKRLEEIRRKYDTPIRRYPARRGGGGGGSNTRVLGDRVANTNGGEGAKLVDLELKKSITTPTKEEMYQDKWVYSYSQAKNNKSGNYSPTQFLNQINKDEGDVMYRKIKEMKESSINKSYNEKIRTTKSIYWPKSIDRQSSSNQNKQSRVENIDRINQKIQLLLNCLKQSQTKNMGISEKESKIPGEILQSKLFVNVIKPTVISSVKGEIKSYTQNKKSQGQPGICQLYKRVPTEFVSQIQALSINPTNLVNPIILNNSNNHNNPNNNINPNNTTNPTNPINSINPINPINSTNSTNPINSTIPTNHTNSTTRTPVQPTSVGKIKKNERELDKQIRKIELKIQEFEQQKKKLNIQFKPYNNTHIQTNTAKNEKKHGYQISKFEIEQSLIVVQPKPVQTPVSELRQLNQDSFEPHFRISNGDLQPKKYFMNVCNIRKECDEDKKNCHEGGHDGEISKVTERSEEISSETSIFKIKLIPVEEDGLVNTVNGGANQQNFDIILSQQIKKANEGIQQRQKKLQQQITQKDKPHIRLLVSRLCKQIQLDEVFRNGKHWFESNQNKKKYEQLQNELKVKGIIMSREQIKVVFIPRAQEKNPFQSSRQCTGSIQQLITGYMEAQQHNRCTIYKKFQKQALQLQQFTQQQLDLQMKGYIVSYDLIRYFNMETRSFYRNRDFFLILQRINQEFVQSGKVMFGEIIGYLCQ